MNNKLLRFAFLVVLLHVASGCTTHYGAAVIKSSPPGAEVVDLSNDALIGITPVKAWWKLEKEERLFVNIRFQKDGFRDKTMSFWLMPRHNSRENALVQPQLIETTLEESAARKAE